ncbi:hypothetical protein GCM10009430_44990 [Aquimarina litoralis]|uniref:Uncharacterized protein n=1 Tax=Aquimarina litoralis TaxID=584605 RepID=A0ABP3UEQ7_9FLAO
MTIEEQGFWAEFRFRITRNKILNAYCDWIEPKSYYLNVPSTIIEGKAGFLMPEMEEYNFKLIISKEISEFTNQEWLDLARFIIDADTIDFNGSTLTLKLVEQL